MKEVALFVHEMTSIVADYVIAEYLYRFAVFLILVGGDKLLHLHPFPHRPPFNSSSSLSPPLLLRPSGVGFFQETGQVPVPVSAPVFLLLRPSEEVPPPPGAAVPEGETFIKNAVNLMCLNVILVHPLMCVFVSQVCANLRDMCVVFAGPFPAGFSEREARRLFRCCGPVRKIKMLNTAVRVHPTFVMILYFTFKNLLFACLSPVDTNS